MTDLAEYIRRFPDDSSGSGKGKGSGSPTSEDRTTTNASPTSSPLTTSNTRTASLSQQSTSVTPSNSPQQQLSSNNSKHAPVGAIVGGVLGALALLLIGGLLAWYIPRRRYTKRRSRHFVNLDAPSIAEKEEDNLPGSQNFFLAPMMLYLILFVFFLKWKLRHTHHIRLRQLPVPIRYRLRVKC